MNLKSRVKSYSFWVSLSSAVFLLLKLLGQQFGFYVDENLFSDLFTTLCGIMVILGIIVPPASSTNNTSKTIQKNNENNLFNSNAYINLENNETNLTDTNNIINNDSTNDNELEVINNDAVIERTDNLESTLESNINDESEIFEDSSQKTNANLEGTLTNENKNPVSFEEIKLSLINLLKAEEDKFSGNYTEFKHILQNQINMLQDKE